MARGGARPGAGRRKGVPNKMSEERVARAVARGLVLPHERMYQLAENLVALAAKYQPVAENPNANEPRYVELAVMAIDAHSKVAPYYANRMSAVKLKMPTVDLSMLTDAQLEVMERARRIMDASGADAGANPSGAGATIN